jgi:hypothetical protein
MTEKFTKIMTENKLQILEAQKALCRKNCKNIYIWAYHIYTQKTERGRILKVHKRKTTLPIDENTITLDFSS